MSRLYKENCGFMKLGCCTFKPEHCRPEQNADNGYFCDLYNLEFSAKAIRKEIKRVKKQLSEVAGGHLKVKDLKNVLAIEKKDKNAFEVIQYKKKLAKIRDLGKGLEYLDKAYRYCKRTRK